MTNVEHQVIGVIIGASITILAFQMLKPSPQNLPITQKSNFAVVDTYKGCDVVQWTNGSLATYKYFLDCTK